jgi:TetR/AcrR family transcriptional regulator, fatty acid metabolism regulator protein
MKNEFTEKKIAVLESATRIISEKGFSDATISEIAKGAGLTGSGIYGYYKNKDDLLFNIIENFLIKSDQGLTEHLKGIQGAENKLRKAVWFHCMTFSSPENRQEITIVLESRSNPGLYRSKAYDALKKYAGQFTDILREGIGEGTFHGISSPMIIRDMILGTVDYIAINWMVNNTDDTIKQSDEQAEKIHAMVTRGVCPPKNTAAPLNKKDEKKIRIINAATALFARKGFTGTSMLEIARKADVAEGTVYEYFRSKEDLLISIPEEKLGELYDTISGNSLEKRLRDIILNMFRFYNTEKNFSTVLVLMLRANRKFYRSGSYKIHEKMFETIKKIIVQGQAANIFRRDLDLTICQNMLFGTVDHIMIPWIMFDRKYNLEQIGENVSGLFLNAIRA